MKTFEQAVANLATIQLAHTDAGESRLTAEFVVQTSYISWIYEKPYQSVSNSVEAAYNKMRKAARRRK